ncbi:hypothetical protein HDR58_08935 [bacterium]|nr:hypothetical protein [bacterium]
MKKVIILAGLILAGSITYAEISMPSGPSFNTQSRATSSAPSNSYKKTTSTNTNYQNTNYNLNTIQQNLSKESSLKMELDSLATSILKAAEQHDQQKQQQYMMKMMEKGVDKMCPPQIISKRTPQCPPIRIQVNNRELRGSTCALTCYELDGRKYEVGYCK